MDNSYRDEFLAKLDWRTCHKGTMRSDSDISITLTKDNRLNFTFRNGVAEKIAPEGYFTICVHKNRMLFKGVNSFQGYRLTTNKSNITGNCYGQIPMKYEPEKVFTGNHSLRYDDFLELYYIEVK